MERILRYQQQCSVVILMYAIDMSSIEVYMGYTNMPVLQRCRIGSKCTQTFYIDVAIRILILFGYFYCSLCFFL